MILHAQSSLKWQIDIYWSYKNFRFALSGIGSQPIRLSCFKLKKLDNYMRYQDDFLFHWSSKNFMLFWVMPLYSLFPEFFTFELFDLLILVPEVYCWIVLVLFQFTYGYLLLISFFSLEILKFKTQFKIKFLQ